MIDPERLCISCMRETDFLGEVCEHCGSVRGEYQPEPHHLPPMTILHGRYLLGRVLGEGGFGITYIAYDLQRDQRVAVKELFIVGRQSRDNTNTVLIDQSKRGHAFYLECKDKFLQEAVLLSELANKSGVVELIDYFEENATAYIVMEYLEGEDLLTYVKERGGKLPYKELFELLRPVMRSMILVHRAGVIHRDISPDNIRHLKDGRLKIMDFGSSKFNYADVTSRIVLVKTGYAPPEQYVKNYAVGPWMDVYAMSATLYRCITGRKPKVSKERQSDDDIVFEPELGVPQAVQDVLRKGMSLDWQNRYGDMWAFYQALKPAVLDAEELRREEEERRRRDLAEQTVRGTEITPTPEKQENIGAVGGLIAGAVVVIAVAALVIAHFAGVF